MTKVDLKTTKATAYQTPSSIVITVEYIVEGKAIVEHNVIPLNNIKILTYFPRSKALEIDLTTGETYSFTKVDKIGYKSHNRHINFI